MVKTQLNDSVVLQSVEDGLVAFESRQSAILEDKVVDQHLGQGEHKRIVLVKSNHK